MRCPVCDKEIAIAGNVCRPFCSKHCRLRDLNSWFTEQYRVPADDGIVECDDDGDVRLSCGP